MPEPIARIRLTNEPRDFCVISAAAGMPLIDRFKSTDSLLLTWLGRFVAEPVYSSDHVSFFLRDDRGRQTTGLVCEPATLAELRGKLRGELEGMKTRLRQAVPPSASAKQLHEFIYQCLTEPQPGLDFVGMNCQFYKYLDHDGVWKVVWCPGFAPTAGKTCIRPTRCRKPECRRLITGNAEAIEGLACPDCKEPLLAPAKPGRLGRKLVTLLLLVTAVGGGGWWWYDFARPAGSLVGHVRSADGLAIVGAKVLIKTTGKETVSDAEGKFRIDEAGRGEVVVDVTAAGYRNETVPASLVMASESTFDVVLKGAAQLQGRVVYLMNGKEVPVPLAKVIANSRAEPLSTDDEGRFSLDGLLGHQPVKFEVAANGYRQAKSSALASVNSSTPLRIVLLGDRTVTGRVVYDADTSHGVADAAVSIVGLDGVSARSDARGQFTVSGIPPIEVQVQASSPGLATARVAATAGGNAVAVRMKGDATVIGEVIRRDTNQPVPNIEVRSADLPFIAQTDEQGRFRMAGVPSGPIRLRAAVPGLVGMLLTSPVANETTTVQLVLTGGATLRGRVIDGQEKTPVSRAVIRVADTSVEAKTDATGSYELVEVPEAATSLTVTADNFLTTTVPLKLSTGEQKLDDVILAPGGSLQGRIVSAGDLRPLPGAEITLVDRKEKAVADTEGKFSLGPLPLGPVVVRVTAPAFGEQVNKRELKQGADQLGDVILQPVAAVVGRIVRALDKRPLADAEIEIVALKLKARANDHGEFRLEGVPYGAAALNISASGYLPQVLSHNLAGPELLLDDTSLVGDTAADGLVVDATDKQPIAGATIDVEVGQYKTSTGSGANGKFLLGNIPAGAVRLNLQAPGYKSESITKTIKPDDPRIEISLIRLVDAAGVVVDAVAVPKQAVPNAKVILIASGAKYETVSAHDGGFEVKGVVPGDVQVEVHADGYLDMTKTGPASSWLEVPLSPLLRVRGRVVRADAAASGIAAARVAVSVGNYRQETTSDASGGFVVNAPVGNVNVNVAAEGFIETETTLRVAGAASLLQIRLPRAMALEGFVVNAINNQAVPGATVTATVGASSETAVTNERGIYSFQNLPAGTATVSFSAPMFQPLTLTHPVGGEGQLRAVLSPTLAAGEARIVLLWADRPRDMDAHVLGDGLGGPFHLSFEQRSAGGTTLDIDDKDGFGPETCTLKLGSGTYRYYVTDPANIGTSETKGLRASAAEVHIYTFGADESRTFRVPANPRGPVWHVCDLTLNQADGKIVVTPRTEWLQEVPEK